MLATVRTRTPIRAFGPAHSRDTIFCVADKRLLVHDATTLERIAEYGARFPRYSNAIRAIGPNTVALAAPRALVEYELPTGKARRPLPAPARWIRRKARVDHVIWARSDHPSLFVQV